MWIDKFVCSKLWRTECGQTHTQTHATRTDKKVKAEGPMISSNDIFYFKTVMIIGGPISLKRQSKNTVVIVNIADLISLEYRIHFKIT